MRKALFWEHLMAAQRCSRKAMCRKASALERVSWIVSFSFMEYFASLVLFIRRIKPLLLHITKSFHFKSLMAQVEAVGGCNSPLFACVFTCTGMWAVVAGRQVYCPSPASAGWCLGIGTAQPNQGQTATQICLLWFDIELLLQNIKIPIFAICRSCCRSIPHGCFAI